MRALSASCVSVLLACAFQPCALPQDPPASEAKPAVQVTLELRQGDRWHGVDPQRVFQSGDELRFGFRASLGGYLYVLDHASDGESGWLFPRPEQGQGSTVEPGALYLVPGTKGSFVVGGKPGFDVTYWILSSTPMDRREARPIDAGIQPNTLEPRCRTEILKARGLCVDERAGPRQLMPGEQALKLLRSPLVPRDLKFRTEDRLTRIPAPSSKPAIVVYEFRIAHN